MISSKTDKPKRIILLFIDGLGIGGNDPRKNPCTREELYFFRNTLDENFPRQLKPDGVAFGLDANLGVPGLPQSATGQTALFTGVNAPELLGRHLNHRPNEKLRQVIREHSIFRRLTEKGKTTAFLNGFRPPFFDIDPEEIIHYLSVTSCMNMFAGQKFFDLEDLWAERCVYQDMSGDDLRSRGFDAPVFTPAKAGEIIARQSLNYDLSLYEYFQTDFAGHSLDMQRAVKEMFKIEEFLSSLLQNVDLTETMVLLTSDHGNIEDISFKGHTRNPAMTLAFGLGREELFHSATSIMDVAGVVEGLLG
ncbi:hypothetical protein JXQ31_00140 [candidate division KSB1 bacterium]|nr:hypothetical protein [candidate division KSB1 bacterium]